MLLYYAAWQIFRRDFAKYMVDGEVWKKIKNKQDKSNLLNDSLLLFYCLSLLLLLFVIEIYVTRLYDVLIA